MLEKRIAQGIYCAFSLNQPDWTVFRFSSSQVRADLEEKTREQWDEMLTGANEVDLASIERA